MLLHPHVNLNANDDDDLSMKKLAYVEIKMQISCSTTVQLISAFVFAILIVQALKYLNLKFQACTYLLCLCQTWLETSKANFLMSLLSQLRSFSKVMGQSGLSKQC